MFLGFLRFCVRIFQHVVRGERFNIALVIKKVHLQQDATIVGILT